MLLVLLLATMLHVIGHFYDKIITEIKWMEPILYY